MLADIKAAIDALIHLRLREFFSLRLVRMGMVGFTGFVTQAVLFEFLAIRFAVVRPSTATLIGAELSIIEVFLLHNWFTFRDRRASSLPKLLAKFPAFNLGVCGSLIIQWITVRLAESFVGDQPMLLRLANVLGVCLGFMSNYFIYTRVIWRANKDERGGQP